MKHFYNLANYFYFISKSYKHKIALKYKDNKISYVRLNRLSNQIANYFLSIRISSYDVVGVFNTKEYLGYASMLACLKIGAIYTNLDVENPLPRLEKILKTCEAKLLVCDQTPTDTLIKAAKNLKIKIIDLTEENLFSNLDDNDLDISNNLIGSTPAYIMFTSGSTGIPKGVTISHQSLINFLGWSINKFEINCTDIFAQVSPMYFDNSVFDFYTALFSGASLAPVKKEITTNILELTNLVDSLKCTIWFSVPSFLIYLQTMRALSTKTFKSIRVFTFGGEGFPKAELRKLYSIYSNQSKFINVYGPTEGTCICTSYDISEKDFENMNTLAPLGKMIPNFEKIIVNEKLEEVNKGEKGELCLVGPNVALGYYNDLNKTNQNFIQNPLITTHRDIIYRTGDIVYENNGLLWFAGRLDNQIKHMGYRIELEEIESALNSLEYINQSAVLYKRVNENYGKIIAFVATDKKVDEIQIGDEINKILPKYMIPNIIEVTNALPKNNNGKIDKKKLNLSINQY